MASRDTDTDGNQGALPDCSPLAYEDTVGAPNSAADLEAEAARAQLLSEMFGEPYVPARVGPYEVLRKVGAGAMGVVYAARDEMLERTVALKVIAQGTAGSEGRARLVREAQALARLNHPNVVQIFDVGHHEDRIYLAMEFVEGRTLGEWLRARPRPWQDVIRVFRDAGRGLAAAHQQGLVHRDFKPDNVMVGPGGRVQVMDFGLARLASTASESSFEDPDLTGVDALEARLTADRAVVGTPAYMAPEQFSSGTATAQTDQFSLCVALYEGLYGRRPFHGDSLAALAAHVRNGPPDPRPDRSPVPRAVHDAIERGLRPDPDDRFPSVEALFDVLDAAQRSTSRAWIAVAVLAIAAFSFFVARSDRPSPCEDMQRELQSIWNDGRRNSVHNALTNAGGPQLHGSPDRVQRSLDAYASRWATARTEACEATHVRGNQSEAILDARMTCYQRRLDEFEALVDVMVSADATVARKAVAASLELEPLDRCGADQVDPKRVPAPPKKHADAVERVERGLSRATALRRLGRLDEALAEAKRWLEPAERLRYEPLVAAALYALGQAQFELGAWSEAETALAGSYDVARRARLDSSAAASALTLAKLVGVELARVEEGHQWVEQARALAGASPAPDVAADILLIRGRLSGRVGDYALAQEHLTGALRIREDDAGAHVLQTAEVLVQMGVMAMRNQEPEHARQALGRALELQTSAVGDHHATVGVTLINLGNVERQLGNPHEATELYERALAIFERVYPADHPHVAAAVGNLGVLAQQRGDHDDAIQRFERVLLMTEASLGPEHPRTAKTLANLGYVRSLAGDHEAGLDALLRALRIEEQVYGLDHAETANTVRDVAALHFRAGQFEDALAYFERSASLLRSTLPDEHVRHAAVSTGLGKTLIELGRPDDAIPHLEQALRVREHNPTRPGLLAETQLALGRALWPRARERARARRLVEAAVVGFEEAGNGKTSQREAAAGWLATHPEI